MEKYPSLLTQVHLNERRIELLNALKKTPSSSPVQTVLIGTVHRDLFNTANHASSLPPTLPTAMRPWHDYVLMTATAQKLMAALDSGDDAVVLSTLEDMVHIKLEDDEVKGVVPSCISLFQHHDVRIRSNAVAIVAKLMREQNVAIVHHVAEIGRGLGETPALVNVKDGSGTGEVYTLLHKDLCWIIGELQKRFPGKLMPFFNVLVQYLINAMNTDDLDISTAACQYWSELRTPEPVPPKHMAKWVNGVHPKLTKLVPALIKGMIYTPEHIQYLETKTQEQAADFRPKTVSKEMERFVGRRNFCAAGMENICKIFRDEVVGTFKLHLIKRMRLESWQDQEAAMLALATFTNGLGLGVPGMEDIYPELLNIMLESLKHTEPLVRSMACFVMQNYVNFKPNGAPKNLTSKMVKRCIALFEDNSMEVQEMGLRLMVSIIAYADFDIASLLPKITDGLVKIEPKLFGHTRYALYEATGHMFGKYSLHIEANSQSKLLQPLIAHWDRWDLGGLSRDNPDDIAMLCQPICAAAMYCRGSFSEHQKTILNKITKFFDTVLNKDLNGIESDSVSTTIVTYLDIMSAMFEGQSDDMCTLSEEYHLPLTVLQLAEKSNLDEGVQQAALAFLGHASQHCFDQQLLPGGLAERIIAIIEKKLESRKDDVRATALWTLSQIAANCREKIDRLFLLTNQLSDMFMDTRADENVVINSAMALTNMAVMWKETMVRVMIKDNIFVHLFALMQTPFPRDLEKIIIFTNLCEFYKDHIAAIEPKLWAHFCVASAILDAPNAALHERIKELLKEVRKSVGNMWWNKINAQMGQQLSGTMRKKYKLY